VIADVLQAPAQRMQVNSTFVVPITLANEGSDSASHALQRQGQNLHSGTAAALQSSPGQESLQRQFGSLSFQSPAVTRRALRGRGALSLTPVIEEFSHLRVPSTPRPRHRSPSEESKHSPEQQVHLPEFYLEEDEEEKVPVLQAPSRKELLRKAYEDELGVEGMVAWEL